MNKRKVDLFLEKLEKQRRTQSRVSDELDKLFVMTPKDLFVLVSEGFIVFVSLALFYIFV